MSYYFYQPQQQKPRELETDQDEGLDLNSLLSLLHQEQFNQHQSHPFYQPIAAPQHFYQQHPYYHQSFHQQPYQRKQPKQKLPPPPQQQQQALPPSARPRVVKKLETEDEFQIQIYKPYGNFNNYEVQVIRQQPPLIKIVISGPRSDNFKVENTFNLNYIDIDNINWRWNKRENILSLNIPKKLHYIHSNVEDVLNCLFGGHVFEPESKELQFGHNDEEEAEQEEEEEAEQEQEDDSEDETLEDHEKIIREAANALKNQFVITPINGSASAEKKEEEKKKKKKNRNEEAQAKAKAKAEDEEAKAKAKAKAEEEEAKAKAKAKAEEEKAKAKAEAIAQRKREILAQQKEAEAKVKQAQLELERLVQQQHELEKQHKSKEAHEVESKEHVLESLIRDEEDKIYENEQEQISQFLSQSNQSKTQSKTQKENQKQQQQQRQDFLNQFFGFNLGPALNEYSAHAPIQNQTAKSTQQKHLNQKQNSQRPTRPVKPAKSEKLKSHIINNNEVLNSSKLTGTNLNEASEPKTPILNGKEGNSSKSNTIPKRYSPSMEDVEDEESIMWRKKFDH
ncbi:hypothetical protein PVL30_005083 [Lodderomyces elongisporus]|uniref:uncharacterized protein n=1 Tax=Lodderomyces elongisporus TaxID=36914 RepID=UPI00291C9167|nr:uncharacterized protein PVL30_005083 [Lodderomyces elongisporus]WLF81286.1 hypothetical protein PVL30_005083 [Lodderomyces elongisporus]